MGGVRARHTFAVAIAAIVAVSALACDAPPRAADAEPYGDAEVERDSDAGQLDDEHRVVGGIVSVMLSETPRRAIGVMLTDRNGARFHTFGARSKGGAPFDPDTTFEIGSVSKVFAGVLLAEAERRGEVALDDAIQLHLRDWVIPSRDGRVLTLRHAATHFTGLPLMPSNWVKTSGGTSRYTETMFRAELASSALASAPGERFTYGNLNTALIGLTLERRSGLPYSQLLQERIFDPLGMSRSGYPDREYRIDANMLDGYEDDETLSVPRIDVSPMGPCCVVRSTLRDMAEFAAAALDASSPLAAAFARAAEPQFEIDPHAYDSRWIGLGWEIDRRLGLLRKSGQVAGYRCDLVLQPRARRGMFVVVNSMRAKILGLSDGLVHALWDPRPEHASAALAAVRAQRVPEPAERVRASFGDAIALEAWEVPAHAAAGSAFEVSLYWRSLRPTADDYRVFVHGDPPASGAERASADHYVRSDATALAATTTTRDWQPGMLIRDRFRVTVPDSFPPGELTLWLGWHRGALRLPAASETRAVEENRLRGPTVAIAPPQP